MIPISQQECRGILDFEFVELIIKTALINKVRSLLREIIHSNHWVKESDAIIDKIINVRK